MKIAQKIRKTESILIFKATLIETVMKMIMILRTLAVTICQKMN